MNEYIKNLYNKISKEQKKELQQSNTKLAKSIIYRINNLPTITKEERLGLKCNLETLMGIKDLPIGMKETGHKKTYKNKIEHDYEGNLHTFYN